MLVKFNCNTYITIKLLFSIIIPGNENKADFVAAGSAVRVTGKHGMLS